ncbi:immunity protein Tsi6 family protein [Kosakonia sp. YIM B13605]|uniref:immunity protein Tsi6 family protein n=1 Tax=Kosakonia TaxID=1330547 RepID=UPI0028A9FADA|nr:immunity protein Tsi6 family protein [Kosakonia sacchari]
MPELTASEYIEKALNLVAKRCQDIENNQTTNSLVLMYQSIAAQLKYLKEVVNGTEKDKSKLRELTFGIYAAKEFESSDEVLFERLTDAFYIASQIRKRLKVQLPHQIDKNYYEKQKRLALLYPDDFDV